MNFKKFISGVSALAIAASAFAGMAVTANAETINADYTATNKTLTWTTEAYTSNIGNSGKTWDLENDFADISLVCKNSILRPAADGFACSRCYTDQQKGSKYGYIIVTPKFNGTLSFRASTYDEGGTSNRDYTASFYVVPGETDEVVLTTPSDEYNTNYNVGSLTVKGSCGAANAKSDTFSSNVTAGTKYYVYANTYAQGRCATTIGNIEFTANIDNATNEGKFEGNTETNVSDGTKVTAFSQTFDPENGNYRVYVTTSEGVTKSADIDLSSFSGPTVVGILADGIADEGAAATIINVD